MGRRYKSYCQSCGLRLSRDPQGGGSNADGSRNKMYCSHCFGDGRFILPDITIEQMQARVRDKLREKGVPGFLSGFVTRKIPRLTRWQSASLTEAKLKKLNLEIEKLTHEIGGSWYVTILTPLLSVSVGVAGFLLGVHQYKLQQDRALAAARFEQTFRLHNTIRADAESLLNFFKDKELTLSGASFRFDNLRINLSIAEMDRDVGERIPFTDMGSITYGFVRAVEDDCDFERHRDAEYVTLLLAKWPQYSAYLKSHPSEIKYITEKYADAAIYLYRKAPEAVASVEFYPRTNEFEWHAGYGNLTSSDVRHFYELVAGFRGHLRLLGSDSERLTQARLFAQSIRNDAMASSLVEE